MTAFIIGGWLVLTVAVFLCLGFAWVDKKMAEFWIAGAVIMFFFWAVVLAPFTIVYLTGSDF